MEAFKGLAQDPHSSIHQMTNFDLNLKTPTETRWIVVRTIFAASRGVVPLVFLTFGSTSTHHHTQHTQHTHTPPPPPKYHTEHYFQSNTTKYHTIPACRVFDMYVIATW